MTESRTRNGDLVQRWRNGDRDARNELLEQLQAWMEKTATEILRGEGHITFTIGDLVNEAVVRLMEIEDAGWQDRAHVKALSARLMRRILIDHARSKQANRRAHRRVTLVTNIAERPREDLLRLSHALQRLSAIDAEKAEIVEMRYFGGMTVADISLVTGLSERTVKRRWNAARAWLVVAMDMAA
ncbi:MAG: ECF-type sigma factor [Parasphingopyxis sp.]|uniref:ECF-type sigma factor n=1 Tax=Parasphingopyxis sp. TaxID=1920299 RepID=UPI003FA084B4